MVKVILRRWDPTHILQILFSPKIVVVMAGDHVHLIVVISGGICGNCGSRCGYGCPGGLGLTRRPTSTLHLLRWRGQFRQNLVGIHRQGGCFGFHLLLIIVHVLRADILRRSHIPIGTTAAAAAEISIGACRFTCTTNVAAIGAFVLPLLFLLRLPSLLLGRRQLRRRVLQRLRLAAANVAVRGTTVVATPRCRPGQPPDLSLHPVDGAVEALQLLLEVPHRRPDGLHLLPQRLKPHPLGVALRLQGGQVQRQRFQPGLVVVGGVVR